MKISDVNVTNVAQRLEGANVTKADVRGTVDNERTISKSDKINQMNMDGSKEDKVVIDDEMLEKSVEQANKTLENYNRYIERSVHEKTRAIMYVMKDSKTDEVIREFPPKKIQDMIAKMWELAGLFVDEKA